MSLNDVLPTKPAGSEKPGSQALNSREHVVPVGLRPAADLDRPARDRGRDAAEERIDPALAARPAGARQRPVPDEGVLELDVRAGHRPIGSRQGIVPGEQQAAALVADCGEQEPLGAGVAAARAQREPRGPPPGRASGAGRR